MSQENIEAIPVVKLGEQESEAVLDFARAGEGHLGPPTAEQVRTADGVFTQQQEQKQAADLMGMWASALMLHDLAREHLDRDEEEREPEKTPQPEG